MRASAQRWLWLLLVCITWVAWPAAAQDAEPRPSQATLPLSEILRLYRETDAAKAAPAVEPPPIRATVQRLSLDGRVLDDAIDFKATFRVVVLAEHGWIRVPLMTVDPSTHMSQLPEVQHGVLAVDGGQLVFVSRHAGSYGFEVAFLKQARREGSRREVRVAHAGAALAVCRLAIDDTLFRLNVPGAIDGPEGVVVYPRADAFELAWERRAGAVPKKQEPTPRPAIESVVRLARASTVSTLEGQRITRVLYALRLAGPRPLEIEVPPDQVVERVYVNGVSVPSPRTGTTLPLEVAPTREGDDTGSLEIVLSEVGEKYFLSGTLRIALPRVSWPINELYLDVHLPQVFNYTWAGGSLAPVEQSPSANYTYDVPLPGKRLSFHQHLISAAGPDLALEYSVDLAGHFFAP